MIRVIGILLVLTLVLYVFMIYDGFSSFCPETKCEQSCVEDLPIINDFNIERDYTRE